MPITLLTHEEVRACTSPGSAPHTCQRDVIDLDIGHLHFHMGIKKKIIIIIKKIIIIIRVSLRGPFIDFGKLPGS